MSENIGYFLVSGVLLGIIIFWFLKAKHRVGRNKQKNYRKVDSLTNGLYFLEKIEKIKQPKGKDQKLKVMLYLAKIKKDDQLTSENYVLGERYSLKVPASLVDNQGLKIGAYIQCQETKLSFIRLMTICHWPN